jgi:hypothetical protein
MGTDSAAAEEEFVWPAAWTKLVHPRRGGVPGPEIAPDRGAVDLVTGWQAAATDRIAQNLANPASDRSLVEAAQRHLGGTDDPCGAAVVAHLAVIQASVRRDHYATVVDYWVFAYGLPFAAAALTEWYDITGGWDMPRQMVTPSIHVFVQNNGSGWTEILRPVADRVRAMIASCDGGTYREVVAALGPCRRSSRQRIVVSYLVPGEADWLGECCEDPGLCGREDLRLGRMLYCSVGSARQLEKVRDQVRLFWYGDMADVVATVVDGAGADAAPLFGAALDYEHQTADIRRLVVGALVEISAFDAAFRELLDRIDQPHVLPGVVEAARRYPRRALRLAAEPAVRSPKAAAAVSRLLTRLVMTEPGAVADVLPMLDTEARAAAEAIAAANVRVPMADLDALPSVLTSSSWKEAAAELAATSSDEVPAKPPVVGAWLSLPALPQVRLIGEDVALPEGAMNRLVELLSLAKPGLAFPGIGAVRKVCDPASLAAFGWAAFEDWQAAGSPPKDAWTLAALGGIGDDDTVRRLTPLIHAWPGENGHHRAVAGLDVLAGIGTDTALTHLHQVAQRAKFKALKTRAGEKIAEVAAGLGLTGEQLSDRLVPDLGLDADGSTVIDYGPRRFTVGFDEGLRPYVQDAEGKRRKDLPAPNAKDDADLAAAERKRFAELKKAVRAIAADENRRLEAAMVSQRSWSPAEFRAYFVDYPVIWHLTRRLVWRCDVDGATTTFRVAEGAQEVGVWSDVFGDYEIVQPFPQLGRFVHAVAPDEAAGARLHRFEGITVPVGKMLGLTRRGWERGAPMDNGTERWISRKVGASAYLVIALDPGIQMGMVGESGDQTLDTVWLDERPRDHWGTREYALRFDALNPIVVSEVIADLIEATAV